MQPSWTEEGAAHQQNTQSESCLQDSVYGWFSCEDVISVLSDGEAVCICSLKFHN